MIPKIIHYCWFGNKPKNKSTSEYINKRRHILPDFQIIEWNEGNCDLLTAPSFVREAYEKGKWAFVSDYYRLKALYEFGGVYFDTDVELLSTFNDLLLSDFFCCFESNKALCTAVIGCTKKSNIIFSFLQTYEKREFEEIPNSFLLFEHLIGDKKVDINNVLYLSKTEFILPYYYFSPINFYTNEILLNDKTIAIHHYESSWKSKKTRINDKIKKILYKILGEENYMRLKNKVKK